MSTANFDLLLTFLSALGGGSWQTFRRAVRVIGEAQWQDHAPAWLATVTAEQLAALGHVEFAFDGDLRWTICPTILAGTPSQGRGCAVLCGARPEKVLEALRQAAERRAVRLTTKDQRLAPSIVRLIVESESDLFDLAAEIGLEYVPDASGRLLGCLPTLGSMVAASPISAIPSGYSIYQFDPTLLRWQDVDQVQGDGSYRFECYRPEFRIIRNDVPRRVSRTLAVHEALARVKRSVFTRDELAGRLGIPTVAQLPGLYARVLMLYIGEAPSYDGRTGSLQFVLPEGSFIDSLEWKIQDLEEFHE